MLVNKENEPLELNEAIDQIFGGTTVYDLIDDATYAIKVDRPLLNSYAILVGELLGDEPDWSTAASDLKLHEADAFLRELLSPPTPVEIHTMDTAELTTEAGFGGLVRDASRMVSMFVTETHPLKRPGAYLLVSLISLLLAGLAVIGVPAWAVREVLSALAKKESA